MVQQAIRSTCSYCGVGCGVLIDYDRQTGLIDLKGNDDYPVNRGMLCAKRMNLHHSVMSVEDRLTTPMMRANRQLPLQASSWDDALKRTAKVFSSLIDQFGPDSVGFYVSGQLLTEEYYIVNKLMKGFIGSNNIDTNSRLCMSSAVVAQKKAFGEDSVPVCYDDIEAADCLLIAGANPAWCHPILFRRMEAAKQNNPQVKWIVVDPRQTQSTQMADLHLQIIPGTDIHVFHGLARRLIETDRIDHTFIAQHVNGFEALREQVMSCSLDDYAAAAGIRTDDLVLAADWIADAQGFLSMWTMGLNQSVIGVNKNLALINLSLITGKIGRPGNGPFSLTGQPNAMGGRKVRFDQGVQLDAIAHDHGRANNLTQTKVDPFSKQPNFKFSAVQVEPVAMAAHKVIVIGAGAGSAEFVQQYRAANPLAQIEVFSKEPHPFYNRILLPDYLSGHKGWSDLQVLSAEDLHQLNITVHAGVGIERIDPEHRCVVDDKGQKHHYDDLLVATGSRAFVPSDVPEAQNILGIRQREDVERIGQYLHQQTKPANVVVLGGGLLGLEMADAFLQLGHQVHVVQISDRLMSRQLDELSSGLLKKLLRRKGIHIHLNDQIVQYIDHPSDDGVMVRQVKLKSGRTLDCDWLIVAVGTRPNIELLKDAQIDCQYGVCVNPYMQTSAPNVYAIGEIAELNGHIWGISPAAQEQAGVVARVLSGDPHAYYSGSTLMNILKLHDVQLASIGMSDVPAQNAAQYQVIRLEDLDRNYYKKCIIHRNRLVGAIMLGDKNEFNEFRRLIDEGIELNELRDTLLRPGGVVKPPLQGALVCSCNNIGDGNIRACIREGAQSLEAIMSHTGAGTGCGSCKPEIIKILAEVVNDEMAQGAA